jgi:hypothetical protein
MPKIDVAAVPERRGAGYPPPFAAPCAERMRQRLGNAGGLSDFGVNLMRLPPGNWSSQRHWHSHEDEFVYVLEGEVTLIEDGARRCCGRAIVRSFRKAPATAITDQQIGRDGGLSRGRIALARRPHHLLRHRHDEFQCRRAIRPQGWHALS